MASYRVFAADLVKHRDVLLALWRRNLKDTANLEAKIEWHFVNNPNGDGQCWLIEADGEVVGTTSLGLRQLKVGDRIVTIGVACDLAVEQKHRFLQPALMLQKQLVTSIKPPIRMIYGFPGPTVAGVLKRVGYQQLGVIDRYVKILKVSRYLERHKKFAALSPLVGEILDSSYAKVASLREPSHASYVAELVTDFDERFDEFWNHNKDSRTVLTVRDSRFLRWRYRDCPLRRYTTITLLSRDRSRLLGYLIYYVENSTAVCADLFADNRVDTMRCLLAKWLAVARKNSLSSVSVACSADRELIQALKSLRFVRRTLPLEMLLQGQALKEPSRALLAYQDAETSILNAGMQWYFTPGDQPYN